VDVEEAPLQERALEGVDAGGAVGLARGAPGREGRDEGLDARARRLAVEEGGDVAPHGGALCWRRSAKRGRPGAREEDGDEGQHSSSKHASHGERAA
jgi:hypothetical protein